MTIREIIDSILDSTPGEMFQVVFFCFLLIAICFAGGVFLLPHVLELVFGPFTTYP